MDFFGMYVLALLTGVGGGILRSVLIGDLPTTKIFSQSA